jgi:hypothetical protein
MVRNFAPYNFFHLRLNPTKSIILPTTFGEQLVRRSPLWAKTEAKHLGFMLLD